MSKRHFYTNIDINSSVTAFLGATASAEHPREEDLYPFVDAFAGSQITDVLFCTFCQYSAGESEVWTDYADKMEQKEENGIPVDYTELYRGIYTWNRKLGVDPYAVWLKRCRELGLSGWLSFRMNDCHCPDDEASFLRGDFFYEAREKGWMIGSRYGYYRWCFDYAVPEVRGKMLAYLREQLERYDPDGVELDFQREIHCFDYVNHPDCAPIMTDFVRKVRALVKEAETKKGHSIRLGVRLMRDIAQNLVFGFDAAAWVREGLVDLITVTPRWATCDSDMPIAEWKRAFPDTEIAAGLEILCARQSDEAYASPAVSRGYAVRYFAQGADSLYLFNRFFSLTPLNPKAAESDDAEINRTCGDPETASALPYRFVLTCQDTVPEGSEGFRPLPRSVSPADPAPKTIVMKLGRIPEGRSCAVLMALSEGSPENAEFSVNGRRISDWQPVEHGAVEPDCPFRYAQPGSRLYRAEIEPPDDAVISVTLAYSGEGGTVSVVDLEAEVW